MIKKQAVLITAYKDFDQLVELINFFDDTFSIYIHIDKKSKVDSKILERINSCNQVKLISRRYKVNWGSIHHLLSYLSLAEEALKDQENCFFHLITGQDYPIKSLDYFKTQLNIERDYLDWEMLPVPRWSKYNGMDRLDYYNLHDLLDDNKNYNWVLNRLLRRIQLTFRYKRPLSKEIGQLYGGSTYWSLSKKTLEYVVNYTKNKSYFINRLRYCFCSEEIYLQTVIMNSGFSTNVINSNLRYYNWETGREGPAILDERDFEDIVKSDNLFARKFDSKRSNGLKERINTEILN